MRISVIIVCLSVWYCVIVIVNCFCLFDCFISCLLFAFRWFSAGSFVVVVVLVVVVVIVVLVVVVLVVVLCIFIVFAVLVDVVVGFVIVVVIVVEQQTLITNEDQTRPCHSCAPSAELPPWREPWNLLFDVVFMSIAVSWLVCLFAVCWFAC